MIDKSDFQIQVAEYTPQINNNERLQREPSFNYYLILHVRVSLYLVVCMIWIISGSVV